MMQVSITRKLGWKALGHPNLLLLKVMTWLLAACMTRCCSSTRAGFSYDDRVVLARGLGRLDIGELLGGQIVGQHRSQPLGGQLGSQLLAGAGQLLPGALSVVPLLGGLSQQLGLSGGCWRVWRGSHRGLAWLDLAVSIVEVRDHLSWRNIQGFR